MRVRLKMMNHDGLDWIAVGVNCTDKSLLVVLMRDDRDALMTTIPYTQWNALPWHWFEDKGPAPPTEVLHTPEQS